MAVTATGSRFRRNNMLILALLCIAGGLWFAYDGWINDKYQEENTDPETGKANPNLQFNRYVPIPLAVIAVYSLIMTAIIPGRRVVADDKGLTLADGCNIPYESLQAIDKRAFDKDGHFTISYAVGQTKKTLKLSDRKYDNLGLLLDEVISQTGAAPANQSDADGTDKS